MIRIVPIDSRPDNSITTYEKISFDIFIGIADKTDKDGLELIYETLEVWETEIKTRMATAETAAFFWRSTKQDEDRLQNVKVIAMRVDAIG